ncbi:hypothetical protein B0H19DRAFT_1274865 [Mycena capillaripes]|nr:hypothetical protein B0H19DRAFT_1274865 [Mycena capillaripes]
MRKGLGLLPGSRKPAEGRYVYRLKLSEEAIKKDIPNANILHLTVNLSSFASIRKAAAEVNALPEPLDVLIHNAAASFGDFKLTEDGVENRLATDYVGPFLFTKLLAPKLVAATTPTYAARVVFISGLGHSFCTGVDFAALTDPDPEKYMKNTTFFQADDKQDIEPPVKLLVLSHNTFPKFSGQAGNY